jgi:hypothetical protein
MKPGAFKLRFSTGFNLQRPSPAALAVSRRSPPPARVVVVLVALPSVRVALTPGGCQVGYMDTAPAVIDGVEPEGYEV